MINQIHTSFYIINRTSSSHTNQSLWGGGGREGGGGKKNYRKNVKQKKKSKKKTKQRTTPIPLPPHVLARSLTRWPEREEGMEHTRGRYTSERHTKQTQEKKTLFSTKCLKMNEGGNSANQTAPRGCGSRMSITPCPHPHDLPPLLPPPPPPPRRD